MNVKEIDLNSSRALTQALGVALLSFGGPAGQIAVMHHILVDEKHWISESRFLHLNYSEALTDHSQSDILQSSPIPELVWNSGGMKEHKEEVL